MSIARENEDETENVPHSKAPAWESALSTREDMEESAPWQMKQPLPLLAPHISAREKSLRAHSLQRGVFSTAKMARRRVY
jgi:hypothetical protein